MNGRTRQLVPVSHHLHSANTRTLPGSAVPQNIHEQLWPTYRVTFWAFLGKHGASCFDIFYKPDGPRSSPRAYPGMCPFLLTDKLAL